MKTSTIITSARCYLFRTFMASTILRPVLAESAGPAVIQFCKQDETVSLGFCMAAAPYQNTSSDATDLYLTITRHQSFADGWLGIGLGPSMTGALMFILYADPENANSLTTSIRKGIGHHQPVELSAADFSLDRPAAATGLDIRVIKSAYHDTRHESPPAPDSPKISRTATTNIVIYSANLWPSVSIGAHTVPPQPWIWAHNPTQHVASHDNIKMHTHDQGNGYGFFWADFASVLSSRPESTEPPPPFPTPKQDSSQPPILHHTTTTPPPTFRLGGPTIRNWMWHLHGLLMTLSTLLLYPLGALLLRTSDPRAFNFHWTTQSFSSVLLVLGGMLGWVLSRKIVLVHQVVGLAVLGAVGLQVLLGWRHHVKYLRTMRQGTWMGKGHVWIGRGLMVVGWGNVVLGLLARGYGFGVILAVGVVIVVEAVLLIRLLVMRGRGGADWAWWGRGKGKTGKSAKNQQQRRRQNGSGRDGGGTGTTGDEEYFELVGDDDDEEEEDEDYDEDGRLKADVLWEEEQRRRKGEGDSSGGGGGDTTGVEETVKQKLKRLDVV